MKIFTKPKVTLIAQPILLSTGVTEFLRSETTLDPLDAWTHEDKVLPNDAELLPEFCGRMCYGSFGSKQGRKTNKGYLENIIKQGHGSVLEHSNFTFLVTQASRGFTHEMVRHRAGFAYSQESTHFIDYTDPMNWSLCIDGNMANIDPAITLQMIDKAKEAFKEYGRVYTFLRDIQQVPKKQACSMARQILPTGIESKIAFTANARALRHFIEYRCNKHNVLEIAEVAYQVADILKKRVPNLFDDIELITGTDEAGLMYKEAVSKHKKV